MGRLSPQELAERYPVAFTSANSVGRFIGNLHVRKPLSDNPRSDALEDAARAAVFMVTNNPHIEGPEEIDAVVKGFIEGTESAFEVDMESRDE